MLDSDNSGGSRLLYQRNHGFHGKSLAEQQVLVVVAAAVLGWEYEIFDPDAGEDGRWRGVDDDHCEE